MMILVLVLVLIHHIAIPTKLSSDDFASAFIYNDSHWSNNNNAAHSLTTAIDD